MICVSIARGRHRQVIAEHRHLAEAGAELVELRLDYITGQVNLPRLLKDKPCPVIITIRREHDGGKWDGTEEQRMTLIRTAVASGVEYIDLEEDIAGQVPRFGDTKRIISLHDFQKTPDDLDAIHARMAKLDPDVIKIATMANQPHDNVRMLRLVQQSKIPTVGLCMGEIGTPTRILSGRYGAPFGYATFHHERALAPGQLSYDQMKNVYRYDELNDDTEVFGVIADPIGHSLSPLIHNTAFKQLGMNKVYVPIRVPRKDLSQFIDEAEELGIKGLSVTIPHKEAVIKKLTKADGSVRGIGATNTIVFNDGERLGYNTDYLAALESLENALGGPIQDDSPLRGRTALILGAGGVGKAIAYGLIREGAKVALSDGENSRATELADRMACDSIEWDMRHAMRADILVNCTPVGMHPNVDDSPFEREHMHSDMVVFDAVYNPESTLFLKYAKSRDCKIVTGVEMFVRQACHQFKLFTGKEGPADVMRDVIKRATSAAKY